MSKFSIERVPDLSREELIVLVLQLAERIQQLEQEVERLKKPPATSNNSSMPSSREPKPNLPSPLRPRPRGAKPGHAKMERPLSETPDQVIVATVERCVRCGLDVGKVMPIQMLRRQVTELPVMKPMIIETQQPVVICPRCHHEQRGRLPSEFADLGGFGARLEATVTYLQHQQHLGYQRTERILKELWGVEISAGGQARIIQRVAGLFDRAANTFDHVGPSFFLILGADWSTWRTFQSARMCLTWQLEEERLFSLRRNLLDHRGAL